MIRFNKPCSLDSNLVAPLFALWITVRALILQHMAAFCSSRRWHLFGGLPITLRGTNQLCDRPVLLINDFEPLVAPRPLEGCRGITSHNGRNLCRYNKYVYRGKASRFMMSNFSAEFTNRTNQRWAARIRPQDLELHTESSHR